MSYSKLRGRIREMFGTEKAFAEAMGMTNAKLSMLLNNKTKWSLPDAQKAKELLKIADADFVAYFFTPKFHKL